MHKILRTVLLSVMVVVGASLQLYGQTKFPRFVSMRRFVPIRYMPAFIPNRVRIPPPMIYAPSVYFSGDRYPSQLPFMSVANNSVFQRRTVREYPSRVVGQLPQYQERQNNAREVSPIKNGDGSFESRISNIETRLSFLESLASEIKSKLNNIPSQSPDNSRYDQRLTRLEEQMQALRDVIVELRDYLKSRK
jgi:uncharacterized coiled-coil protein SlyX